MTSLRRSFRIWWQPPRRLTDREAERQVTFLELFYDLVYAVLIAELAHMYWHSFFFKPLYEPTGL